MCTPSAQFRLYQDVRYDMGIFFGKSVSLQDVVAELLEFGYTLSHPLIPQ
tara:strand:- start:693 stop:842 length:150 start_codon:yes stop_codon:yes gene_type:complete